MLCIDEGVSELERMWKELLLLHLFLEPRTNSVHSRESHIC
jgi:hypothetical protein